ncbi:MAG: aspartate/glutamate racemase family protein, partial [Lachnospiraceae bacterium]|nr:aspartate/glutamate racemase family protein [Lachnospiraceae bacterium]
AVEQTREPKVLVMATPMTIREEKFRHLFLRYANDALIEPLPCPGLMEYVERGEYETGEVNEFLEELLEPYRGGRINAVVIGCTHYTFVTPIIERIMGPEVKVFDGAYGTAKELKRRIEAAGLLRPDDGHSGKVVFESSDPSPEKTALCEELLRLP